jgi:hypothetical protein
VLHYLVGCRLELAERTGSNRGRIDEHQGHMVEAAHRAGYFPGAQFLDQHRALRYGRAVLDDEYEA